MKLFLVTAAAKLCKQTEGKPKQDAQSCFKVGGNKFLSSSRLPTTSTLRPTPAGTHPSPKAASNANFDWNLFSMSRSLTFSALGSAVHAFREGSPLAVLQFVFAALILIPESWFLRPLLRIFGFGPLGPVKGNEIHLFALSRSLTILGLRICCCIGAEGSLGRCC